MTSNALIKTLKTPLYYTRRWLQPRLVHWLAPRDYDLRNTLVVAGGPRTGTTWLAEMLIAGVPGSAMVFEPLNPNRVPQARAAGMHKRPFIEPHEDWPDGEFYFENVLRGKIRGPYVDSRILLTRTLKPKRWIVKMIGGNMLLGWLCQKFPILPPVLIVRHPCAVVASLLATGWLDEWRKPRRYEGFLARYPQFHEILDRLTKLEEFIAADWCFRTYAPLALSRPYPFQLITYEELVLRPEPVLRQIFDGWGLEFPETMLAETDRPSSTSYGKSARPTSVRQRLTAWQHQLSPQQIHSILGVVKSWGINFYSSSPEPDRSVLYGPDSLGPSDPLHLTDESPG